MYKNKVLDSFGASKSIVQEVREEENQLRSEDSNLELRVNEIYFERILANWQKIIELIGRVNPNAPPLLSMSKPLEFDRPYFILGFDYPIFRDKFYNARDLVTLMNEIISSTVNIKEVRVKAMITRDWEDQKNFTLR